MKISKIPGFYNKARESRLMILQEFAGLDEADMAVLASRAPLDFQQAEKLIENVVAIMPLPMGIATNFVINGRDYLVPMVTEEPSVIAGASFAAKLARETGGFFSQVSGSIMTGQIVLVGVKESEKLREHIEQSKKELLDLANKQDAKLVALGGGAQDLEVYVVQTDRGPMGTVNLVVDVKDAMGANIINTMLEAIAPKIEHISGGTARLKIVSNLADKRLVTAHAIWSKDILGPDVIENILDACAYAQVDQYRATTHNKGIMNGIDAVALATGNDFRAIEAGAHSFAVQEGLYKSFTKYEKDKNGDLLGQIKMPLAVGIVGGMTKCHPTACVALKILGVKSAGELASVMASVGLAQNFAALRALVTEGIQAGHMKLHGRKGRS
ncbi:MAG: hydroxymethylglutaryl-CoA reductase, degradative [bacterium]